MHYQKNCESLLSVSLVEIFDNTKKGNSKLIMNSECINVDGSHLVLDCTGCNLAALSDKKLILDFIEHIIQLLGMKKLTEPVLVECDGTINKWDKGGVSAFVMIAESHISLHTFPQAGLLSADIFSCKPFNVRLATDNFTKVFSPVTVKMKLLNREVQIVREKELLETRLGI
jgi:S-adenosylmethionine decarboxylase